METLLQDIRYGLRILRKYPAFTAAAVSILALGIGANTAIFSLLNSLFLQRLPVQDPSQLVHIYQNHNHGGGDRALSYPDFVYYRKHNRTLSDVAAQYPGHRSA
jgi:putative ABC transport system permease protein